MTAAAASVGGEDQNHLGDNGPYMRSASIGGGKRVYADQGGYDVAENGQADRNQSCNVEASATGESGGYLVSLPTFSLLLTTVWPLYWHVWYADSASSRNEQTAIFTAGCSIKYTGKLSQPQS